VTVRRGVAAGLTDVAFDPQTSGGLLIALPAKDAPRLVKALRAAGVAAATTVGTATRLRKASVEFT
jgi:selenide,water dikinase